jgi:exodeoxyribonuclease VII small subunit
MNETFEEKYKKMQTLLEELEANKDNLDESLKIYKKAKELYSDLENQLKDYKAKIEVIGKDE